MATEIDLIFSGTCIAVLTLAVLYVYVKLIRSKQIAKVPVAVKVSLLGYAVFVMLLDATNVYLLLPGNNYDNSFETTYFKISYELSAVVFMAIHWLFTSHYL